MVVIVIVLVVVVTVSFGIDSVLFIVVMVMAVVVAATVTVRVVMEEDQANDVGSKTKAANNADEPGVLHFLRFHQSLSSLQEDRHAQGN